MEHSELARRIISVFEPGGKLSQSIKGFEPRMQQRDMVESIINAWETNRDLVVEAGTGTGKTFSYLIPNMLLRKKMIVSTGTKNLQDQLIGRDIPLINMLFSELNYRAFALKGRSNYICLDRFYKIKSALSKRYSPFRDIDVRELGETCRKLDDFMKENQNGDLSQFGPAGSQHLNKFRCGSSCGGENCPYAKNCYFRTARELAKESDLIVVNHSLLMYAYAKGSDEPDSEILPSVDVVVFDEAHKVPDYARAAFSSSVSNSFFEENLKEIEFYIGQKAPQVINDKQLTLPLEVTAQEEDKCRKLSAYVKNFRIEMNSFARKVFGYLESQYPKFVHESRLQIVVRDLEEDPVIPELFVEFGKKAVQLQTELENLLNQYVDDDMQEQNRRSFNPLHSACEGISTLVENYLAVFKVELDKEDRKNYLTVFEADRVSASEFNFHLVQSKLKFADSYVERVFSKIQRAVYTSATLMVNGNFFDFASKLGIDPEQTSFMAYGSPFNYTGQGCLYLPYQGLPSGNDFDSVRAKKVFEQVKPLLRIIDGGFFILCTNMSVMRAIYSMLEPVVKGKRNIYLQGQHAKIEIMRRMQKDQNAVVVATSSFWEGVDVKGKALSCVVIDRLPFPNLSDPLTRALCNAADEEKPKSSFSRVMLPQMLLSLKQGVGRLIRSCSDYGVIMIADDRMNSSRSYVSTTYSNLPPFRVINTLKEVEEFWNRVKNNFPSENK